MMNEPTIETLALAVEAELDEQVVDLCLLRDAADAWANARRASREDEQNSQPRPPSAGSDSRVTDCAMRESQPGFSMDKPDGNDTLEVQIARLTTEKARLRSDYNLLLGETQMLRELARKFETELASARTALTKSRDETQAMQDRASDLAATLCNTRAQLDEVRAENSQPLPRR
jgi:hypothetical protein